MSADGYRACFSVLVTLHLSVLFNVELRVCPRHRNTKPDKRQQGIRQPIHPPDIPNLVFVVESQVHADVEKLVHAETRDKIRFEAVSQQVFFSYVEIPLERRYTPTKGAIRQQGVGPAVFYAHTPVVAFVGCVCVHRPSLLIRSMLFRTSAAQYGAR